VQEFESRITPELEIILEKLCVLRGYLNSFLDIPNVDNRFYRQLVDKVKAISRYSNLLTPEISPERFILAGDVVVILPPPPIDDEIIRLGRWIAEESSLRVREYMSRFDIQTNVPLPVVMVKTNKEVAQFVKRHQWAGVVSLSYAPICSLFNCEAMSYCLDKLGIDLGSGVVRHSYLHENAHPIMARERYRIARELGYPLKTVVETTRAIILANTAVYEFAANDIQDNFKEYPYRVASLESRHHLVTPHNVVAYSYGNIVPDDDLSRKLEAVLYPFQEKTVVDETHFEEPFVASYQSAHASVIERRLTRAMEFRDPSFSWSGYLLGIIREDPLLENGIPMPQGFDKVLKTLDMEYQ